MGLAGAAAIMGGVKAAEGIAGGITQAVQARQLFNEDDEQRLKRLQARQKRGELGLNETQRKRAENQQAVVRGGFLRRSQDQSQQAMAALANERAVSGADLFLAEQARQDADAELVGRQEQAIADLESQMAMSQRQEIAALLDAQRQKKAGVRGGIAQALTLGLAGAGGGAAEIALQREQADMARQQREKDMEAFKRSLSTMTKDEAEMLGLMGKYFDV